MDAIILTSLLDDGRYAAKPDFFKDVWPLLEANLLQMDIRMRCKKVPNRVSRKYLSEHAEIAPNVWEIDATRLSGKHYSLLPGSMDWFSGAVCYDHLAVLFKCSSSAEFFRRLLLLWPVRKIGTTTDITEADLHNYYGSLKEQEVVFGFGHDGDPMVVVGMVLEKSLSLAALA